MPTVLALAGAAFVGAAQPAAASETAAQQAGPYGPAECDDTRYVYRHYGYQVSSCYPWFPTYPGNPGGGYWFDYWV